MVIVGTRGPDAESSGMDSFRENRKVAYLASEKGTELGTRSTTIGIEGDGGAESN